MNHNHICIVDDSAIARDLVEAVLLDAGFDHVTAFGDPTVVEATLTAAVEKPDLILMDIMMPEIDGIELCARLRMHDELSDTPILMVTSRDDMIALESAFVAGANDYLTKPFQPVELVARIRNCLRLKAELDRRKAREEELLSLRKTLTRQLPAGHAFEPITRTGLSPRDGFEAQLKVARTISLPVGLMAFRLDGFEAHQAQLAAPQRDANLAATIDALLQCSGQIGDVLTHWDDAVFCLLTHVSDRDALAGMAERLRADFGRPRNGWQVPSLSIAYESTDAGGDPVSAFADVLRVVQTRRNHDKDSLVDAQTRKGWLG